ncbi:MAG: hypothetical protein R2860_10190 [Desulfobacterales bacterium]
MNIHKRETHPRHKGFRISNSTGWSGQVNLFFFLQYVPGFQGCRITVKHPALGVIAQKNSHTMGLICTGNRCLIKNTFDIVCGLLDGLLQPVKRFLFRCEGVHRHIPEKRHNPVFGAAGAGAWHNISRRDRHQNGCSETHSTRFENPDNPRFPLSGHLFPQRTTAQMLPSHLQRIQLFFLVDADSKLFRSNLTITINATANAPIRLSGWQKGLCLWSLCVIFDGSRRVCG